MLPPLVQVVSPPVQQLLNAFTQLVLELAHSFPTCNNVGLTQGNTGDFKRSLCVGQIAKAYEAGGAACLSVLTDARYFQGSFQFLADIRAAGVACPLLCKEFIVEAYQLFKVIALAACYFYQTQAFVDLRAGQAFASRAGAPCG